MNTIAPFTVMFLQTPSGEEMLLLQRSAEKKLFPGLYTGIGGRMDLHLGENDILQAMQRELEEETQISWDQVTEPKLIAQVSRRGDNESVLLFVFSGIIEKEKMPLSCTEGELHWVKKKDIMELPLIPTSRLVLKNFFLQDLPRTNDEIFLSVVNKDRSELFAFPQ